ncbi:LysR family transcriptional regulator [Nocardia arthritidis]|uniref:LysR family transcriptional regulator n=1 Tax=Nocardia arthritidis TaxID=228602 RepID=A0A6G9YUR7_9NOCA|nr:LysR family transcriptional regulator [Nocardia arthritidis]
MADVEIHHLRYFLAVARELNFTRAAQEFHMAVPPLSQRIKALEAELGQQLFDRSTHHVRLTPAGERLLPWARQLIADFDALPCPPAPPPTRRRISHAWPYRRLSTARCAASWRPPRPMPVSTSTYPR